MKIRKKQTWIALLLAVALVVLSGCEAVSGLDLNKAIQNSLSIKSSEGSQTISLEIVPNPLATFMVENDKKLLELFSNVKLTITDAKQQDYTHASLKGIFEYNKGKIPFQLTVADQNYTIMVEGAKKPIVISNNGSFQQGQQAMSAEMQDVIKQMQLKVYEWYPALGAYITGISPNPNNISASKGTEIIGTETVSGTKVHAEIKGTELVGLVKKFLTNMLADEKGLKDALGQIYDLFVPIIKQSLKESESADAPNPYGNVIAPYLNNKTLAVEFAFTFITSNLKSALESFDGTVQSMKESYQGESLNVLLSDQLKLKTDMFIDNDLMPRKATTEVMFTLPADNTTALQSIKLTSTAQNWNINKPVKVDVIDTSAGVTEIKEFNKPTQFLALLDPKSKLYELLKNDLHITKKEINLLMDNSSSSYNDSTKPYIRNGITMVPARFVVEQLESDVSWNQATQQVTITDPVSGAVINLNIGSKQATVNGMIKPLEVEAELKDGTTFVPVRFIAENLGTKVSWNPELQMVTISRD
ncbi:copper amine oxidase N-terminal domain-containing protein [Paenibacillus agricola]|uniref:Copper amine oxidase N-terminal domain-containing protein n=1 Tax=Paenibacillus agricola TaxID=2716264 RepID=A0ABX0J5F8_9BACL|nr:copper amine oxidase N-terminal domain-containing protein [Paenibacillus agricola]NHN30394.1 copper amine oxidase N-terminal domain-containing protein [Paenibacillus agricola]